MRLPESLRRPDWLKEMQAVLAIALAAVLALGVVAPALRAAIAEELPLELPAAALSGTLDYELREGVAIAAEQDVTVTLADPDAGQRAAWALAELPTQAVAAALLALLLGLVRHARREDPFTPATVRRLRAVAATAIAGGVFAFTVELLASMHLSTTAVVGDIAGISHLPVHWLLIGFGLLAVAEVVKRGRAMREELETVV